MENLLLILSILFLVFGIILLVTGIHIYLLGILDKIENDSWTAPYVCTTLGIILLSINYYYLL